MELTRVSRYYPDDMPLGDEIQYFQSEDGLDFYASIPLFTLQYKFCIDPETGVICSVAEDVSRLYPAGFTVAESDSIPDGFDINGGWYFSGGEILPYPAVYTQRAESERQDRLGAAVTETFTLQTALLLGTISDEDKTLLQAWMDYITQLKAMDFTQVTDSASLDGIQWPAPPE